MSQINVGLSFYKRPGTSKERCCLIFKTNSAGIDPDQTSAKNCNAMRFQINLLTRYIKGDGAKRQQIFR
jgi:hypothetical protein